MIKIQWKHKQEKVDTILDLMGHTIVCKEQDLMLAADTSEANPCFMRLRIEEGAQFDTYK